MKNRNKEAERPQTETAFKLQSELVKDLPGRFTLMPQKQLKDYFVDFLITHKSSIKLGLVVEIDETDLSCPKRKFELYERDRHINWRGMLVLRFTGDQVRSNASLCFQEIIKKLEHIEKIYTLDKRIKDKPFVKEKAVLVKTAVELPTNDRGKEYVF